MHFLLLKANGSSTAVVKSMTSFNRSNLKNWSILLFSKLAKLSLNVPHTDFISDGLMVLQNQANIYPPHTREVLQDRLGGTSTNS